MFRTRLGHVERAVGAEVENARLFSPEATTSAAAGLAALAAPTRPPEASAASAAPKNAKSARACNLSRLFMVQFPFSVDFSASTPFGEIRLRFPSGG